MIKRGHITASHVLDTPGMRWLLGHRGKAFSGAVTMNMQVRPLTEFIGAEIVGIDLGKPLDEVTRSRLYGYFADRAVLEGERPIAEAA